MPDLKKKGPRGLPAIARAREERARRGSRWTMQAGLIAAGAIGAGLVVHTIVSSRELSSEKRSLLSKQLAIRETVGAEWFALRDRLTSEFSSAAGAYTGDHVEPEAAAGAYRSEPGLYMRARLADVRSKSFDDLAIDSKKDGFAACLLRERNDVGARGEVDGGAFSEQPWNVGQGYEAMRILDDSWSASVRDATEPLRLRLLDEQLEQAVRSEVPVAAEIVRRAKFFLLVLDEDPADPLPADGAGSSAEEAIQLVDHPARVFLLDLAGGRELFRIRASGTGQVLSAGERPVSDPEVRDAMQRQANNCILARQVEATVTQARVAR